MVVVDEAYWEFAPHDQRSALTLLHGRRPAGVSRTMSKAFAFAGARVGYLAADPAFIDALRLVRLPYHLSSLTQAAALGALRHADTMLAMVDDIVGSATAWGDAVRARVRAATSRGPTSSCSAGSSDPAATWRGLFDRGVLVRDVGLPGTLRVTAGTEEETTAFLDQLASIDSQA